MLVAGGNNNENITISFLSRNVIYKCYTRRYLKIVVRHNIFPFSVFNFKMENLKNPLNFDILVHFYGNSGEVTTIDQSSMFGARPKY